MTVESLSRFGKESSKFESPECAAINDLLWRKDKISTMPTPLSSLSNSLLGPNGFLLLHGRQGSRLPPKFVNQGHFKWCHPNPLPPLRNPDQGRKDQLQTTLLIKEGRHNFCALLLLLLGSLLSGLIGRGFKNRWGILVMAWASFYPVSTGCGFC